MHKLIPILSLLLFSLCFAQPKEKDTNENDEFEYHQNDSVDFNDVFSDYSVELDEAEIYNIVLNSDLEKRYYAWLRKRVRDVWPIVLELQRNYQEVSDSAALIKSKRKKRRYIKKRKKQLTKRFKKIFKELSTSRGQILSKFLHRQTGKTAYTMIKELRGGFNAFFWNSASGAFNIDLKVEFSPKKTREDLFLEVILRKDLSAGRLQTFEEYMESRARLTSKQ